MKYSIRLLIFLVFILKAVNALPQFGELYKNHKGNAGRGPLDFANQIKFAPLLEML